MTAVGNGDAAARAEGTGAPSPYWLLEPAAEFADSRWQDRPIWRVVVAAPSASLARQAAEAWAVPPAVQIGNESDSPAAGFSDEKLYVARRIDPQPEWQARRGDGPAQVVDAELVRPAPDIIEL